MKYKNLYILLITLLYSVSSYATVYNSVNESSKIKPLTNSSNNVSYSNRVVNEETNSNNSYKSPIYIYYKPEFYNIKSIEESEDSITSNIFNTAKDSYLYHTFRGPMASANMNSSQHIVNGNDINLDTRSKISSSISGSYLYSLTSRFKLGPEIIHTTYNSKANISINDTFSLMVRSEFTLYKSSLLEVYSVAGAGLSFNTLNLIYTRLTISTKYNSTDSFREHIVKPIINGSSVPHKTAYFYCSTYARFNNLKINVINDVKDPMKGISEFTGDGFGICVYQNSDSTKNATIEYQEFLTPEKATSIPWFIGIGIDYNLSPIVSKLIDFTYIDKDINSKATSKYELGVSVGLRYFNNGDSTVKYKTTKGVDQYTIKYKGYFSLNLSLFMKM